MKQYAIAIILSATAALAAAQGRILPITEMPSSPETLAAGNAAHAPSESFLYSTPGAVFHSPNRWHAAYSAALLPANDGTHSMHTLAAATRLGHNAFFLGGRYHAMGALHTFVDNNMNETSHDKLPLYAYTVDGGYARMFSPHLSAWATAGFASEHTATTINAFRAGIGADYAGQTALGRGQLNYKAGLSATNLGGYSYTGHSGMLSPRIGVGGHTAWLMAPGQTLALTIDGGLYMKTDDSKQSTELSGGFAYTAFSRYTLRVGGHTGDHDDYAAAGLSVALKGFTINAATTIPLHKDMDAIYMAGLTFEL